MIIQNLLFYGLQAAIVLSFLVGFFLLWKKDPSRVKPPGPFLKSQAIESVAIPSHIILDEIQNSISMIRAEFSNIEKRINILEEQQKNSSNFQAELRNKTDKLEISVEEFSSKYDQILTFVDEKILELKMEFYPKEIRPENLLLDVDYLPPRFTRRPQWSMGAFYSGKMEEEEWPAVVSPIFLKPLIQRILMNVNLAAGRQSLWLDDDPEGRQESSGKKDQTYS